MLLFMIVGAGLASAATPSDAVGTIHVVSNVVDASQQAGRNTKIEATADVVFTGTFAGTAVENYSAVTHPSGTTNLHGRGFFTGTVDGRTGTFEYVFHGDENGGMIIINHASVAAQASAVRLAMSRWGQPISRTPVTCTSGRRHQRIRLRVLVGGPLLLSPSTGQLFARSVRGL